MRYVILMFVMLLVTACASKEHTVVSVKYEYVTYKLPKELTTTCKPPKPISNVKYSNLTDKEREEYLTNYSITLMGSLKKCDNKIRYIEEFIDRVNESTKDGVVDNGKGKTK